MERTTSFNGAQDLNKLSEGLSDINTGALSIIVVCMFIVVSCLLLCIQDSLADQPQSEGMFSIKIRIYLQRVQEHINLKLPPAVWHSQPLM